MNNNVRKLTDGAMMCAIVGVVLLINRQLGGLFQDMFLFLFPIPMVFYSAKYGWKEQEVIGYTLTGVKDFAGKRRVLNYDVGGNRGFVTEYNGRRLWEALQGYFRTVRMMREKYTRACVAYREAMPTLVSREFWDKYLRLK